MLTEAFLKRSRALWVKREREYKKKAAHAHEMHQRREGQLAALAKPKVSMPLNRIITDAHGYSAGHDGIDLICPPDEPALAMVRSKVVRVSAAGWWGNNPQASQGHPISDGDGIIILESLVDVGPFRKGLHLCYGHAEKATVKVGQVVEAGQVIGRAGFANAWHVHFMVNDDKPVNGLYRGVGDRDPRPYLKYAKENQ